MMVTIWFHLMPIISINYIPLVSLYIYIYDMMTYMTVTVWFHLLPIICLNYISLVSFNIKMRTDVVL